MIKFGMLTGLKCLQYLLINLEFILQLSFAEVFGSVLGYWRFAVVFFCRSGTERGVIECGILL